MHLARVGELAVDGSELVALVVAKGQHHVVAIFVQVAKALGGADAFLTRTVFGCGITDGHITDRRIVLGNEVDHAGDGIGTVQSGSAIGQQFHAFNCRDRDRVQVETGGETRQRLAAELGQAFTVQQDERTRLTHVMHGDTGEAEGAAANRGTFAGGALGGRELLDQIGDRGGARCADGFSGQDGDRQGAFGGDTFDRRAGDFNALDLRIGALRILCNRGLRNN
ncbi:hypothetical protein D3C81_842460 [compost metagenome]